MRKPSRSLLAKNRAVMECGGGTLPRWGVKQIRRSHGWRSNFLRAEFFHGWENSGVPGEVTYPRHAPSLHDTVQRGGPSHPTPNTGWMEQDQLRSHTFTWHDPMVAVAAARSMSGREYLEALRDGTIPPPPMVALMGIS